MVQCDLCNKKFRDNYCLNSHKNSKKSCISSKECFDCKLCNKEFKFKSKLLEHEKSTKHKLNILDSDEIEFTEVELLKQKIKFLSNNYNTLK